MPDQEDQSRPEASADRELLSAIVKRIRSEPLLFGIAIVLLLLALAARATDLGANLSLFVVAIAGLAALALIGYYVVAALHELQPLRTRRSAAALKYNVTTNHASGPLAIGDNAHAEQTIESLVILQGNLAQHTESLERLKAIQALNATGAVPNDVASQIDAEERAIASIRGKLSKAPRSK
jgi:hypothetical protein